MSVDYTFNKKISLENIERKTKLKIVINKDEKWLVDDFNNHILIKEKNYRDKKGNIVDSPTLELTVYGLNNPTKIIDLLIEHFDTKFITDNEEELLFHEPKLLDELNDVYDDVMTKFGYLVDGFITIPNRVENDYKPFSDSVLNINIDNESLPF